MTELPDSMKRLEERLRTDLEAESVEIDPVEPSTDRFSVTIISPKFIGMPDLRRQDLAWEIVDKVCSREESMMVTAIWALAPGEITTYLERL